MVKNSEDILRISIIVPNYNHRKFLPERLDSIFNQTFQDFELILLDDCSTDGSWEYLKQFENHPKVSHCIKNESNSGSPFKQWKKGLDLAKYEWIWIAESDDYCELNFLEKLVFEFEPSTYLTFSLSYIIDEDNTILRKYLNWDETDFENFGILSNDFFFEGKLFLKEFEIFRNVIPNASAVVFRKPKEFPIEVLEFKYSGDWYFWIYLLNQGKVRFTTDTHNFSRYHVKTTTSIKSISEEFNRLREGVRCINFGRYLSGMNEISFPIEKKYKYLAKFIYKRCLKFGRLNYYFIFPDIPLFLIPYFYYYALREFVK